MQAKVMQINLLCPLLALCLATPPNKCGSGHGDNAITIEEELASLIRAIVGLTKHVQEQDAQIARLINKAYNVDASHVMGKQVKAHDEVEEPAKQYYTEKNRNKIEGSSRSSLTYSKPYTPRIDNLKMPMGYQPPKFQQFDGNGNPK
ncbi:UNVERIFIED_CONTAM: hypothetical protein Scaly_2555000 [Sesamum calycinum]|uniref:Uncharacterized protein n=1 Tax=Sesamum calycinum TaxID=2727403 RepID=A0AAW2IWC0_9LAMI